MRQLSLLLGVRARLVWNTYTRGPRRFGRAAGSLVVALFALAFLTFAALNTASLLERVGRVDREAVDNALPALLVLSLVLGLVTSLTTAFHHFFVASDAELLLASPLNAPALFAVRLLETWRDGVHVVIFQCATLIGFGLATRQGPGYFAGAVLVAMVFTLAGSAVGAMLTMLLARVHFGESVLGLGRILAVLIFVPLGALGIPALGGGRRSSALVGQDTVQGAAASLRALGTPPAWAPSTWAAHVLRADDAALASGVLLAASLLALLALALLTYQHGFQVGWERVRFAGPRPRAARGRTWFGSLAQAGPLVGVLQKDLRTLARDPRWRTTTVVGLVALIAPAIALSAGTDSGPRPTAGLSFWLGLFPVPYLAYILGSQHGAASLAYEGRNITLLRAAPVGLTRLLAAKLAGSLVLVLAITWAATLLLAIRHDGNPGEIVVALFAATWLAVGGTAAGVIGAALTVDFDVDNPQRRVGWFGTLLTAGLSALFFAANTALLAWLVVRVVGGMPRVFERAGVLTVLDWTLPAAALVSVAAMLVAGRFGMQRLAAWEGA